MRLVSRHNYSNKGVHSKSLKYYDMEVKTLGLASKRLKSKSLKKPREIDVYFGFTVQRTIRYAVFTKYFSN